MDTTGSSSTFAKQGQDLADKGADKVQTGIRAAKDAGNHAADKFSNKVESARASSGPTLGKLGDQAQSTAKQTMDYVGAATDKVRATFADVGESVTTYTKDNPLQALLIAGAVGTVLGAVATVWARSRD